MSYKFFSDSLYAINNKQAKHDYVLYIFLTFNVGFNCLQILWLSEIVGTAQKLLFAKDGEKFSIARGSSGDAKDNKQPPASATKAKGKAKKTN